VSVSFKISDKWVKFSWSSSSSQNIWKHLRSILWFTTSFR